MNIVQTALPDVVLIETVVHGDERGFFAEYFRHDRFEELGLPVSFAQDNHSRSSQWVLRGLHYQLVRPQGKLVRPVNGSIYDIAIDLRRTSPTFLQWVGVTLTAGDGRQLYIPPGFGHGYLTLTPVADVVYKCTTTYDRDHDRVIRYDDPELGIDWQVPAGVSPVLSARDHAAPLLANTTVFE